MSTLLEKIWNAHRVTTLEHGEDLVYIDLHLIHEVTSPQAFDGLRTAGRKLRRPDLTFATMDHNVPTTQTRTVQDAVAELQMRTLEKNCREFQVPLYGLEDARQGIVHVIGPELGLTQPGKTIVCGDSHTSTHGAFGALAFGIGTSEVEQVLATQCLRLSKPKTLEVCFEGQLPAGVFSKDMILRLIGEIGTAGATGFVIEYAGGAVRALSMESRMSICNMSIEAGARAGLVAPDQTTFDFLRDGAREFVPQGKRWDEKMNEWLALKTDRPEDFDRRVTVEVATLAPQITWGTSPGMVTAITGKVPQSTEVAALRPEEHARALEYMGLTAGTALTDVPIDVVFIGSCTNSRLEDLRLAAEVFRGRKVAAGVQVLVVPGSRAVRRAAEKEELHRIFLEAGCEWREPGCSMCLGMNPDQLKPQQRCVSTSNRNFEGRQGKLGRTHLASPATAAASAIAGKIADPRDYFVGGS